MDLSRLKDKFPPNDIEWRLQRSGETRDGKPWGLALAYITNRAIMDRLDSVVGPENWFNEYDVGPQGGVICGISIQVSPGVWVRKWDGADNTQVEPVKGGLSDSMKRAAVQWGIGRYLYGLEATFAEIDDRGKYQGVINRKEGGKKKFRWNPPKLPKWALPGSYDKKDEKDEREAKEEPQPTESTTPPQGDDDERPLSGEEIKTLMDGLKSMGFNRNEILQWAGKRRNSDLTTKDRDKLREVWAFAKFFRGEKYPVDAVRTALWYVLQSLGLESPKDIKREKAEAMADPDAYMHKVEEAAENGKI